jgi:hypothetical protein
MKNNTGIAIRVVEQSIKKTVKNLSEINKKTQEAVSRVIQEIAVNIQRDAKKGAPVDFGFLRSSIYMDFKGKGKLIKSAIKSGAKQLSIPTPAPESRKDGLNAIIGTDLDYAGRMEQRDMYLSNAYTRWAPKLKPAIEKNINEILNKNK